MRYPGLGRKGRHTDAQHLESTGWVISQHIEELRNGW